MAISLNFATYITITSEVTTVFEVETIVSVSVFFGNVAVTFFGIGFVLPTVETGFFFIVLVGVVLVLETGFLVVIMGFVVLQDPNNMTAKRSTIFLNMDIYRW
ncbi:hypothetical protein [Flavobacterium turcicum]|uniref:hypothetical protein n=1 Tax=Flavobacterium turcicum TaxID=2764718 RepID=UPI00293B8A23|nr:hypothetical protein [Flavobacterium turcicum]